MCEREILSIHFFLLLFFPFPIIIFTFCLLCSPMVPVFLPSSKSWILLPQKSLIEKQARALSNMQLSGSFFYLFTFYIFTFYIFTFTYFERSPFARQNDMDYNAKHEITKSGWQNIGLLIQKIGWNIIEGVISFFANLLHNELSYNFLKLILNEEELKQAITKACYKSKDDAPVNNYNRESTSIRVYSTLYIQNCFWFNLK